MFEMVQRLFFKRREEIQGFSIICIYNNRQKLDNYLIKSLTKQTAPFELITIDNTAKNFQSAAPLLNEAAKNARYDYLMFVHQDVAFGSNDWLRFAQRDIRHLRRFGAAGVAGKSPKGLFASVFHGKPPHFVAEKRIKKPVPVQTLDGCLLIVPKEVFLKNGFDEKTCTGWHLYVADYCLDLSRRDLNVYVLPHDIYHESTGPADPMAYEQTKQNIIDKHKYHKQIIYSTVGDWKTSY